jgi:hypothetical protein
MVGHDELIGEMLDQLDDLKIADNTIVLFNRMVSILNTLRRYYTARSERKNSN